MYAIRLAVEGGEIQTVFGDNLVPDPLFPDQVVLAGVDSLSWPVDQQFLHLSQWSFKRSGVQNWMKGEVRLSPDLETPLPHREMPEKLFGVFIQMDKGGSGMALCEGLASDPLFPELVLLKGVLGLSLPAGDRHVLVEEWALPRRLILSWMLGPLRESPDLSWEGLVNGLTSLPWPPGTLPSSLLVTHEEALVGAATPTTPKATEKPKRRKPSPRKKPDSA